MSSDAHARTRLLIGEEGLAVLRGSCVAVVGLGGVGGAAAEQLCRAGIGRLVLVDFDVVKPSNLNRQVFALTSTLGRPKVRVAEERLRDVAPGCAIEAREVFFAEETAVALRLERCDWVADCIDSLNPKVQLLRHCTARGIPVITSTGAAARTDPLGVRVSDLFQTRNDPLARHLRRRLRGVGIVEGIPAVHSSVLPAPARGAGPEADHLERGRPRVPVGSISYLPTIFGCVMAGWIVRSLLGRPLSPEP